MIFSSGLVALSLFGAAIRLTPTLKKGFILSRVMRSSKMLTLSLSNKSDEQESDQTESNSYSSYGKQEIVPFDFAREDIVPPTIKEELERIKAKQVVVQQPKKQPVNSDVSLTRPSGYDRNEVDLGDAEVSAVDVADAEYDNAFVKFLKDVYIGSPYDSRNKQQARYSSTQC